MTDIKESAREMAAKIIAEHVERSGEWGDGYEEGYKFGLEIAEEAIVEWLRKRSVNQGTLLAAVALQHAADAIERGDHAKPATPTPPVG